MHDPMVVAWDLVLPIPVRGYSLGRSDARRWIFERRRRTNAENRGEPIYPWWRPHGYVVRVAGRDLRLYRLGTIWHVEPGGRDAFEVCKNRRQKADGTWIYHQRWKWHVHHWRIQIFFVRSLHRRLFERCLRCGRAYPWGYAPVSHQWDEPRARWWHVERRAYHHECSLLVMKEREVETDHEIARNLFSYLRTITDKSEQELVELLCDYRSTWAEYHVRHHLEGVLGYERSDDDHLTLVKSARFSSSTNREGE